MIETSERSRTVFAPPFDPNEYLESNLSSMSAEALTSFTVEVQNIMSIEL